MYQSNLLRYLSRATRLLRKFNDVELEHVYQEENKEANDSAQIAPGYKLREKFRIFKYYKRNITKRI